MDIRRFKDELDELVGRYIVEAPTDLIADMAASLECSAAGLRVAVANTSETPDSREDHLGGQFSTAMGNVVASFEQQGLSHDEIVSLMQLFVEGM